MTNPKLAALCLVASFAAGGEALACSCRPMSRQQAIDATAIVFEGRVLRVRQEGQRLYADIETSRILKGNLPRVVEVGTAAHSAACGYAFKPGQSLTVGVSLSQRMYSTNSCLMFSLNRR